MKLKPEIWIPATQPFEIGGSMGAHYVFDASGNPYLAIIIDENVSRDTLYRAWNEIKMKRDDAMLNHAVSLFEVALSPDSIIWQIRKQHESKSEKMSDQKIADSLNKSYRIAIRDARKNGRDNSIQLAKMCKIMEALGMSEGDIKQEIDTGLICFDYELDEQEPITRQRINDALKPRKKTRKPNKRKTRALPA